MSKTMTEDTKKPAAPEASRMMNDNQVMLIKDHLNTTLFEAGYDVGRDEAYKRGYADGSTTLSRGWFLSTLIFFITVSMVTGTALGIGLDFLLCPVTQ